MSIIVAIDIGNTNIKIGIFDNASTMIGSFRLSSMIGRTSDEYGIDILSQLVRLGVDSKAITGVVIASVNPNLNYTFERLCEYYFGIRPLFVGSAVSASLLTVRYDNGEVGADRIASMVGAIDLYSCGKGVIVIDCGTATTFNVVDKDNVFLGGAIMTGLRSSADALCGVAAKLPSVALEITDSVIATSTVTNMQAGLIYGHIGAVEYIVGKTKAELGTNDIRVVATGGLSEIIAKGSKVLDIIDRTLTLRGLMRIYNANKH